MPIERIETLEQNKLTNSNYMYKYDNGVCAHFAYAMPMKDTLAKTQNDKTPASVLVLLLRQCDDYCHYYILYVKCNVRIMYAYLCELTYFCLLLFCSSYTWQLIYIVNHFRRKAITDINRERDRRKPIEIITKIQYALQRIMGLNLNEKQAFLINKSTKSFF